MLRYEFLGVPGEAFSFILIPFSAHSENHSTHITISTYQQNTWGDFMQHAVEQAIAIGLEEDVGIRSGLPINYLSFLGTGKNMDQYVEGKRYTRLLMAISILSIFFVPRQHWLTIHCQQQAAN